MTDQPNTNSLNFQARFILYLQMWTSIGCGAAKMFSEIWCRWWLVSKPNFPNKWILSALLLETRLVILLYCRYMHDAAWWRMGLELHSFKNVGKVWGFFLYLQQGEGSKGWLQIGETVNQAWCSRSLVSRWGGSWTVHDTKATEPGKN